MPEGLDRHVFRAMGTDVVVVAPGGRLAGVVPEIEALFAEWERALSRFDPESELSTLNRSAGTPCSASKLLFDVVATALDAARATGGIFDPSLLDDLVRIGYDRSFENIASRVAAVTASPRGGGRWRDVVLDRERRTIALPASSRLDVGGIAKGMAVDASLDLLASRGIESALVSAGGDLAVRGLPPGASRWLVAVGQKGDELVPLARGALATSSSVRRQWQQGDRHRHHLLDPRTGEPSRSGVREVTVAAASCAQADVGAKAIFVLGPLLGAAFASRHRLAARIACEDGRTTAAGAWPSAGQEAA